VDDIAVFPQFHGQGVASALLAGAAAIEESDRPGSTLSLDVRAANSPAIALYKHLGFQFGELAHPSFLDWDGGFEGEAVARVVASKCPPNADLSALL